MHKNHPLFSIVIPTFNRAEKLRRALESVGKQTFTDFEVIVCDDGSVDNSKVVVESFSGKMAITYHWENNWGGPAKPRNSGIHLARGEWICFLDSDDWWYPDKLTSVSASLTDADVVHHDLDIISSQGNKCFQKLRGHQLIKPVFVDLLTRGNPISNSSACVRKHILEKTGTISEDRSLISMEDFDLWLRIATISDRFVHIPRALGAYQAWEGNISKSAETFISTFEAIYTKFKVFLSPQDRAAAERFEAYSIGIRKVQQGRYEEGRQLFYRSLQPHTLDTMMLRSLLRIGSSFALQMTSTVFRKSEP